MFELIKIRVEKLKSDERHGAALSPEDFEIIALYEKYVFSDNTIPKQINDCNHKITIDGHIFHAQDIIIDQEINDKLIGPKLTHILRVNLFDYVSTSQIRKNATIKESTNINPAHIISTPMGTETYITFRGKLHYSNFEKTKTLIFTSDEPPVFL